ncbi:MAG TPA: BTAD domain-containing putative transcriptional regulator [Solirubrobacteraceae bacterium]|nr:BTAD domain-containing putative transcriptional regulator [Solirubrobacteraceae bacterium]
MTSFRVLGPVEAWKDERRMPVGGPRQVTLLAFLLLNANRAVSADAVIDAVWGADRAGAAKRLQMGVSRLRRALEPPETDDGSRLRTVGGGYLLSIAAGELDAEVFAERTLAARRALEDGDPAPASRLAREALVLWRGPALADVAFEDFAQPEIRRLEELRLVALETRVEADLQLGRHVEVIGELEGLLAGHPARERLAGQLMTALYRSGRQTEALDVYQRTRTQLAEELGLEPGPTLRALQAQILAQTPALQKGVADRPLTPGQHSRRRLPSPATPTIGREQELRDITDLFNRSGARVVTLTGPGGVGKTRLALVVAHALEHEFEHGVYWVELAGLTRSEDVGSTIVRALNTTPVPGESTIDTLARFVADKRLLLVVDNFEHVLDSAVLIGDLAVACPELRVLATSRQGLGLAAEHHYDLAPMPVPPRPDEVSVAEVERTAGTALFVAAARRHKHAFLIEPATAPLVARVCTRLDGLPLAVEIAAARIGVLTLAELDARLDDALTRWGSGLLDAPARQQTLQDTVRWSYRLLHDDERQAFLRFSVFAGGATLPAAQTVCGASFETLEALQAKSLIRHREQTDGTTRLVMLETLRQFALEESTDRADLEETRRRHCAYYLTLVEEFAARFRTHDEPPALDAVVRDIDNIAGALGWALEAEPGQAVRLAGLLGDYWFTHTDPGGLEWLDAALMAAGDQAPAADRARARLSRSFQLEVRWQWQAALDEARIALELFREARDDAGIASAHLVLVGQTLRLGQHAEARANAEAAYSHAQVAGSDRLLGVALARLAKLRVPDATPGIFERAAKLLTDTGDYRGLVSLYSNSGWVAIVEDRPADAIDYLDLAVAAADKLGAGAFSMLIPLSNMGLAQLLLGNPAEAKTAFVKALTLCTNEAFRWGGAESLAGLAAVLVVEDRPEPGAQLLGAARAAGYPGPDPDDEQMLKRLERNYFDAGRALLGSPAWDRLTQIGAELSFKQAIAFAIAAAGGPAAH